MADRGYRTSRIAVAAEPLLGGQAYDYADAFELRLDQHDTHSAEQWVRSGLEDSPDVLRWLIRFVHAHIARFELGSDPGNVLGWRVVSSTPDVVHLQTSGPLLRADIVARRSSPITADFATYLFYKQPFTRFMWMVVGPLHRRVAPYLLERAASLLTKPEAIAHDAGPTSQFNAGR